MKINSLMIEAVRKHRTDHHCVVNYAAIVNMSVNICVTAPLAVSRYILVF